MKKQVIKLLQDWIAYSESDFWIYPGTEYICYGTGYNGWGVQTHQKAFGAIAVLAVEIGDKDLLDKAIRMLRFNLATHIEGTLMCADRSKWGHTWISVLGIERMMHGVYAIFPYLTSADKELLKKVLISEADWLLDSYPIVAGLKKNNKPESNMWNGAFLYRVAQMYPNCKNAERYVEKAERFLFNALSIESDKDNEEFVGANFYNTYALNHHGYLNVGYMVITLSQIAMLYFTCIQNGYKVPKNLFRNMEGLWQLVKSCTMPDGRLMRIGGDTRVRYCYCQDYLVPVWLLFRNYLKDKDCDKFLRGWIDIVQIEVNANGDGSFLSDRCSRFKEDSPVYYTRLESDRANSLSMILMWMQDVECTDTFAVLDTWHDEAHGAAFSNSDEAFISWSWSGGDDPMGLCIPKSDSTLAEWGSNMFPEVAGVAKLHKSEPTEHKERIFENGFTSIGKSELSEQIFLSESQNSEELGNQFLAFAALPDQKTAVVFQMFKLLENKRSYITKIRGVNIKVPNDIYNGRKRTYICQSGEQTHAFLEEKITEVGNWVNVEQKVGVHLLYGRELLKICSPASRETWIHEFSYSGIDSGNLYCDVICSECNMKHQIFWGDQVIIDNGFAVTVGDAEATQKLCDDTKALNVSCDDNIFVRYASVIGQDGKQYLFVVNFGDVSASVAVDTERSLYSVEDKEKYKSTFTVESMTARLFCVQ